MVKVHKIILTFILLLIGLSFSQTRKVETDTLKARYAFKIRLSGTWYDRSSFFGFLNGSNQLGLSGIADNAINSAKIVDASIANIDIVDPWVGITAGNGLWSSSTTLNLGQLITMKVLTDDSTITITNDTLHVIAAGVLDSAGVREIVFDSLSAYFPVDSSNISEFTIGINNIDTTQFYGMRRYDGNTWGVNPDEEFLTVKTLEAGGKLEVYTGSYSGNGTSQSITGVGFEPILVIIKGNTTQPGYWKCTAHGSNNSTATNIGGFITNAIESIDSDGFSVGNNAGVNSSGISYNFIAVTGDDNIIETGTYTGNGVDNRDIVLQNGFTPGLVWIKQNNASAWNVWRSNAMIGDITATFNETSYSNFIQALNIDGFEVGTNLNVNSQAYIYVAIANKSNYLATNIYTGNGVDDRDINTFPAFDSDLVFVSSNLANTASAFRFKNQVGDISCSTGPFVNSTNRIQSVSNGKFQVGSSHNVNKNATAYYYFALQGFKPTPLTILSLVDSSLTFKQFSPSIMSQIRLEIEDSILAAQSKGILNGQNHLWAYNKMDVRYDTLRDQSEFGSTDLINVGRSYDDFNEVAPLRKWTYRNLGISLGDDKWINDTEEMDYLGNFALETMVFFNDSYTQQQGYENIFLLKGLGPTANNINYSLCREGSNGYLRFKYFTAGTRDVDDTTTTLKPNRWYHIGANIDTLGADSIHFFVDGFHSGSYALPAPLTTSIYAFMLGGDYTNLVYSFFGQMLFARVYNRQLSEGEWNYNAHLAIAAANSNYFGSYPDNDIFFTNTRPIYPDSAAAANIREQVALYSASEDSFRIYYTNTNPTFSICMASSGDTLRTVTNIKTLFNSAAVPYLFFNDDTLWMFWQKWAVAPYTADTVIYRAYSVDYGKTFSGLDTAYAGTPELNNYIIDPVVWLDDGVAKLIISHNQRLWILTSTKIGGRYSNPQKIEDPVLLEPAADKVTVLEGAGLDYINGKFILYWTAGPTPRQYIRFATNDSLSIGGWKRNDYPIRFRNGYKRLSSWSMMHLKKLVIIGENPFDSNYNYYCLSVSDGTSISAGHSTFFRMILVKTRNDRNENLYIDNIK